MSDDEPGTFKVGGDLARRIAVIYDLPPWLVDRDIPRSRREVLKWKLRWIPRYRRRALLLLDKILPKIGLMRVSQQTVKELKISDGYLSVTLRNGFRWSGQQDGYHLKKITIPPNQIGYGDT